VKYGIGVDANKGIRALVAVIAVAGIVVAVTISNRRTVAGSADVVEEETPAAV